MPKGGVAHLQREDIARMRGRDMTSVHPATIAKRNVQREAQLRVQWLRQEQNHLHHVQQAASWLLACLWTQKR